MSTGNGNAGRIIFHESTQSFGSRDGEDSVLSGFSDLRVFRRDRGGVDDEICSLDIFCTVTFVYGDAAGLQVFCHFRHLHVRTGNGISPGCEDFGYCAEADTADADAVNVFVLTDV